MIASRRSALAQWQAEAVGAALRARNPGVEVTFLWLTSEGDRVLDRPLAEHGGKGLFTKVVDQAVLEGRADLAVHSLKDVPVDLPAGLALAAVPARADVRDVLVSRDGWPTLADLPAGARVGTCSPRRVAQLRRIAPQARAVLVRGNVETRLAAVLGPHEATGEPKMDAVILAAAGLARLKRLDPSWGVLSVGEMMPAAAQGALGVVCRGDDHVTLQRCLPLNDGTASTAVHAERELVRLLRADCHSPICVLARPIDPTRTRAKRNADSHWFRLRARVLGLRSKACLDFDERCKTADLRRCVKQAAERLERAGALTVLAAARHTPLYDDAGTPSRPERPSRDDAESSSPRDAAPARATLTPSAP